MFSKLMGIQQKFNLANSSLNFKNKMISEDSKDKEILLKNLGRLGGSD